MTSIQLIESFHSSSINYQKQVLLNKFRREEGNKVKFYFDSHDIIKMMEGLITFEHDFFVDGEEFKTRETLIRALAYYDSWFGSDKIGVLPGHQQELHRKVESKFAPKNKFNKDYLKSFFDLVGLKNFNFEPPINEDKLEKELDRLQNDSTNLFRANYVLDKHYWLDRADYLINHRIDFNKEHISTIITEDVKFKELYNYFYTKRPGPTMERSNFMDAVSLFILSAKLEDYNNKKTSVLPIYFGSTKIMRDIIDNEKLSSLFTTNIFDEEFYIIQDSEFLFLDTLYNTIGSGDILLKQFEAYDKLHSISDIDLPDDSYEEDTLESFEFRFFKKFWFEKSGKKVLTNVIKDFVQYNYIENNEKIDKENDERRGKLLKKIARNEDNLKVIAKVWKASVNFLANSKKMDFRNFEDNPLSEFGLTQFSFVQRNNIVIYLNEVFEKNEEDQINFQGEFISRLSRGLSNLDDILELEIVVSTLYVFKKHKLIESILKIPYKRLLNAFPLSLTLTYGVTILFGNSNKGYARRNVIEIINRLEELEIDRNEAYKLKIGLGYLYFNLWHKMNSSANRGLVPELSEEDFEQQEDALLYKSIELLKKSVDFLRKNKDVEDEEMNDYLNFKYMYSLNNYLFYITRGASKEVFESRKETGRYFNAFLDERALQGRDTHWQNRFEDTLALYYVRSAIFASMEGEKREFERNIESAEEHIYVAIDRSVSHKDKYILTEHTIRDVKKMYSV